MQVEVCHHCAAVAGRVWGLLPDALLVDLDFPLAESFQLLRQLQEDPLCEEVPLLVTSACFAERSEEVGICLGQLGAAAFLARPFSMFELPRLVYSLTGSSPDDVFGDDDTFEQEQLASLQAEASSVEATEARSLTRYREDLRKAKERRRDRSLPERPLEDSVSEPSEEPTALAVERELDELRQAGPNGVLGLSGFDSTDRIRSAAQRRRARLVGMRDDVRCVPRVRLAATRMLDLVNRAEAALLGGW